MNKEKIIELVKLFYNTDHETIFSALVIYEGNDFQSDINNLIDKDFEELHKLYNDYMEADHITGLINPDIIDLIELEEEEEEEEEEN